MKQLLIFFAIVSMAFAQPILVWDRSDGAVSIFRMDPATKRVTETNAEWLDRYRTRIGSHTEATFPGQITGSHVMQVGDIPADRYFRDAWESSGGTIAHNRRKAEKIHRRVLQDRAVIRYGNRPLVRDRLLNSVDASDLTTPTTLQDLKSCGPSELTTP